MKMYKMKIYSSLIFLTIAFSSFANTDSKKSFTACSHELPPHTFSTPDGQAVGLATEVLKSVALDLGWKIEIRYSTWTRARVNAEDGKCDFIYTILKKDEYEKFAVFPTEGLADRHNVFVVLKESHIKFDGDLEKFMKKYKIGLYADKAVSPLFDKLKMEPWARIESPVSTENVMRMLLKRRFDAAIENSATAVYELKMTGHYNDVEILLPPISTTPAYIAFTKNGKALPYLKEFENSLKKFKKTKKYQKIVSKYEP